ncbi:MAG TPA: HD domain-containing protein [Actinomycetota bacterium]
MHAQGPISQRFDEALIAAARRASSFGYSPRRLGHARAAATLVMQTEADPELAVAALLHDAAEGAIDDERVRGIRGAFGDRVARVVAWCSEHGTHPMPPFRGLDESRVAELLCATRDQMIVAAADTVAAVRTLIVDLARGPVEAVSSPSTADSMSWFMNEVRVALDDRLVGHRLSAEAASAIDALAARLRIASPFAAAG